MGIRRRSLLEEGRAVRLNTYFLFVLRFFSLETYL